jgi:hypothetical protein
MYFCPPQRDNWLVAQQFRTLNVNLWLSFCGHGEKIDEITPPAQSQRRHCTLKALSSRPTPQIHNHAIEGRQRRRVHQRAFAMAIGVQSGR